MLFGSGIGNARGAVSIGNGLSWNSVVVRVVGTVESFVINWLDRSGRSYPVFGRLGTLFFG